MRSNQLFHAADLRKGRWSCPGQIYHITTCTRQRQPIFQDFDNARKLINVLGREALSGTVSTLAFVVMPDHLHWLMQLHKHELSTVVGRLKSLSSRWIGLPVWQSGFHDHALRSEENIRSIARYIIANPVRAGLVKDVRYYPHWDAIWL